ncbi:Zn-dependent metalloprotease [Mycolicibacterium iranicum]|uniref:Zn-dependent metalloprotease n=1 Tax=Mycolicibacterium iranicum TaxID=912594 RepID=A0A839Q895_MYCIR|nr:M4 family metallopeptidase [Mycolicibacterium iranicum]MBB2992249.1 Zn-dependent metalloprotease [Mycolicibacterium iranicum]
MEWVGDARAASGARRGMYSGIVLVGIGLGMVVGQGVAAAGPADDTAASQSDDSPGTVDAGPATSEDAPEPDADENEEAEAAAADENEEADAAAAEDDAAEDAAAQADEVTDAVEPAATVRDVVRARPVTARTMVSDVMTWVGLRRPTAPDVPEPAAPVGALVESLWLAVRQTQYTWNNQRPVADVTVDGPGPGGAISGNLNAVDYDDRSLTYHLSTGPAFGRVVFDDRGGFTYTPGAAAAGRADEFRVRIDDTSGNPFHVHGLLGLLGVTRPTEVTVRIPATAAGAGGAPQLLDLHDLTTRKVPVTLAPSGAAAVIAGPFTDRVVVNAADAAAVLNMLAPALGAPAGFADGAAVTASTAGIGADAEHFYRYTETVGDVTVMGSEIILVTNAVGDVTSVFNYYRGLGDSFDVTPDSSVDDDAEVRLIASRAYLRSADDPASIEKFFATSSFTKELVVYTLAEGRDPQLAWRAIIHVLDTGDPAPSGATYVIDADGEDAGAIIVTVSNAHDVATMTTAKDWSGDSRSITVDTRKSLWFRTTEMFDSTRNITTYKTSYGFFGSGEPVLPGKVVTRSLFGWDTGAVSAHANTAVVYDYFKNVLGRVSYDDAGAPIVVSIRYRPGTSPQGYSNAFWDPTISQFAFGDKGYLQAAVDIVAHEYTHAVITSIVGNGGSALDTGEPGALNEAYADIFGVLVEADTGSGRWLMAEDSDYGIVRNLADPGAVSTSYGPHRDRYTERYTGKGDDGGEHVNSTIFSHAAYLMMTDSATAEVSAATWAKVFYGSLGRLSSTAKFVDGRAAVLSSALEQGLTSAQRVAIARAFDAVEIYGAAPSSAIAL